MSYEHDDEIPMGIEETEETLSDLPTKTPPPGTQGRALADDEETPMAELDEDPPDAGWGDKSKWRMTRLDVAKHVRKWGTITRDSYRGETFWSGQLINDQLLAVLAGQIEAEANLACPPSLSTIEEGLRIVEYAVGVDPLVTQLRSVKWDGVPRVDTAAEHMFDLAPHANVALCNTITSSVLRGGCARALCTSPLGVKADVMWVLQGPGYIGKSTLLRKLALRDSWFNDNEIPMEKAGDTLQMLRSAWLHEWGELAGLGKKDANALKAFLSRMVDSGREAYGRKTHTVARRCWLAASVNDADFLHTDDPALRRRFGVIPVTACHVEWVVENRDQLWAEAVARCDAGEPHLLTREDSEAMVTANAQYIEEQPWQSKVNNYLADKSKVKVADVAVALGLDTASQNVGTSRTIGKCIRRAGWSEDPSRADGVRWFVKS